MNEAYCAVRDRAGLIDLSSRGKIEVTGKDRIPFLQGMVTNDVRRIKAGEGLYSALLDPEARILADFHVFGFEDRFLIDCEDILAEKILRALGRYIITEDVGLKNLTKDLAWFGIEGPQSEELLEKISGPGLSFLKPFSHTPLKIKSIPAEIFRLSFTGEDGFYLLVSRNDKDALVRLVLEEGKALGIRIVEDSCLETLRIEAGIPVYGRDMDERNFFPETCLEHAVSRTKGCFLGQEAYSRLKLQRAPLRQFTGFEILSDELPSPGEAIFYEGNEAGYVTSAVFSPALKKNIALGYLLRETTSKTRSVEIKSGARTARGMIYPLPFVSFRKI